MLIGVVTGWLNGLVHTLAGWGIVDITYAAQIAGVVAHGGERRGLQMFATA